MSATTKRVTIEGCIITTEWDMSDNVTRIAIVDDESGREHEILSSQIEDLDEFIDEAVRVVGRFVLGTAGETLLKVTEVEYLFEEDEDMTSADIYYFDEFQDEDDDDDDEGDYVGGHPNLRRVARA